MKRMTVVLPRVIRHAVAQWRYGLAAGLGALAVGVAVFAATARLDAGVATDGKKCECFGGSADCFFDGSRCPVSGGKCKCFKSPISPGQHECCCCEDGASPESAAAADFCQYRCPVKVGGETCGAQCRLKAGHSGKHLCIKLHDF